MKLSPIKKFMVDGAKDEKLVLVHLVCVNFSGKRRGPNGGTTVLMDPDAAQLFDDLLTLLAARPR